uniref:TIP41-like protein n=1 Tax=Plectus sambesii TaxID=2011161 RepID=A0A914W1P1_9BILA
MATTARRHLPTYCALSRDQLHGITPPRPNASTVDVGAFAARRNANDVMDSACKSARVEERFEFDGWRFVAVRDHILPSLCRHGDDPNDRSACHVCEYGTELKELPSLPEMIFPNNTLTISRCDDPSVSVSFDALSALRLVDAKHAPEVKVGPSDSWTAARKGMDALNNTLHPYDWTYTTNYNGSVHGMTVAETSERIDMEKLKRREPIQFYSQLTLFEDELADHGCASLTVRLRVMPTSFFALQRFYLRVDDVLARVIDTRLYGELSERRITREWSLRESRIADLSPHERELVLDPNMLWTVLPVKQVVCHSLTIPSSPTSSSSHPPLSQQPSDNLSPQVVTSHSSLASS